MVLISDLTEDLVLDAAVRIMLRTDYCMTINVTPTAVLIRIPTTRKLAEHLNVPHYAILPVFASMEEKGLIVRVERVGISTTTQGTHALLSIIESDYHRETESLLGAEFYADLKRRIRSQRP